ncbi:hypothetical protein B0H12DRAFT_241571 [Mycena haematopus]|nr:hypothetical protein B0H12DRAFT_241571 [Mycena haematopus]
MVYQVLPFHDSDDFGYECANKRTWVSTTPKTSLYQQIIVAQARGDPSLADLPVELIIDILAKAAFSSPSDARTLALTSSWTSEVTRAARLENVSIRTFRDLRSFRILVNSSQQAAASVRTLWISTNAGFRTEQAEVPLIVEACHNLTALACEFAPFLDSEDKLHPLRLACPFRFALTNNVGWAS